jgi:hypothetical protein
MNGPLKSYVCQASLTYTEYQLVLKQIIWGVLYLMEYEPYKT